MYDIAAARQLFVVIDRRITLLKRFEHVRFQQILIRFETFVIGKDVSEQIKAEIRVGWTSVGRQDCRFIVQFLQNLFGRQQAIRLMTRCLENGKHFFKKCVYKHWGFLSKMSLLLADRSFALPIDEM